MSHEIPLRGASASCAARRSVIVWHVLVQQWEENGFFMVKVSQHVVLESSHQRSETFKGLGICGAVLEGFKGTLGLVEQRVNALVFLHQRV